ncbi:MAG: group II intron maturase-specific domain-containing protein [Pseudomonadales bacterium]
MKELLRKNLTTSDTPAVIHSVIRVVRGWVNYHCISYNWRRVSSFIEISKRILLRWFNRRGGKKLMTWQKFLQILEIYRFPRKENFKSVSVL